MAPRKSLTVDRIPHSDSKAIVFRLTGKLTGTKECYTFLDDLREDVHDGNTCIILNLEKISHISSPGVGIVAACYTSVANVQGRLAIVAPPSRVKTLLKIVYLWDLLDHHANEDEALSAATA